MFQDGHRHHAFRLAFRSIRQERERLLIGNSTACIQTDAHSRAARVAGCGMRQAVRDIELIAPTATR